MGYRRTLIAIAVAMVCCTVEAAPQEKSIPSIVIAPPQPNTPKPTKPPSFTPPKDLARDISFNTLYNNFEAYNVIDIRREDELIRFGQIPGSKNLPLQELEEALDLTEEEFLARYGFPKLSPDDGTLVLTCRSGNRVRFADRILRERGFTKHKIYYGSFIDWLMNGGPIVRPPVLHVPVQ